jgi:hypothetical protein
MAFMKLHCGEINFSEWVFDENEKLNAIIVESVTDVLQAEFADSEPSLGLPFEWAQGENPGDGGHNGPPLSDPLSIVLTLPLADDDNGVTYLTSLSELANEMVDDFRPGGNPDCLIDEADKQHLLKFVDALRALANSLEIKINSGIPWTPDL